MTTTQPRTCAGPDTGLTLPAKPHTPVTVLIGTGYSNRRQNFSGLRGQRFLSCSSRIRRWGWGKCSSHPLIPVGPRDPVTEQPRVTMPMGKERHWEVWRWQLSVWLEDTRDFCSHCTGQNQSHGFILPLRAGGQPCRGPRSFSNS